MMGRACGARIDDRPRRMSALNGLNAGNEHVVVDDGGGGGTMGIILGLGLTSTGGRSGKDTRWWYTFSGRRNIGAFSGSGMIAMDSLPERCTSVRSQSIIPSDTSLKLPRRESMRLVGKRTLRVIKLKLPRCI